MRRSGFTLLEMLIAIALSLALLAALYVALDLQFRMSETGRLLTQHSTLARSLLSRISSDLTGGVGPPDAGRFLTPETNTLTSQTQQTASQTPTTGGSGPGSTQQTTQTTTTTTQTTTTPTTTPTFTLGIQGTSDRMSIFITKLPSSGRAVTDPNNTSPVGDVRRITYWLAGVAEPLGLAKQEITLITSDDATMQPEDVGDESSFIIADEVKSLTFQYWDGTAWQDSWDGAALPSTTAATTATTTSNNLPVGPPLAIKITIGLLHPSGSGEIKLYPHVVAIPTANGIR